MERKIGILASDIGIKETIENLYKEDISQGKIIIEVMDVENFELQSVKLEKQGAKAIIARSGGYKYTLDKVNVPVIQMRIDTLDILHSIKHASNTNKDVVLLLSDLEFFEYEEWKEMITSKIIFEKFTHRYEIEDVIKKYLQKDVIIVGDGVPCIIAQKYNIAVEPFGVSDESVRAAVRSAWQIVDAIYEQKYKNEVLNKILDDVHDAVIAIDKDGYIILYNEQAKELLKKSNKSVLKKELINVFPELGLMLNVLKTKKNISNEILNLEKIMVTANISLLYIDDNIIGALCAFQDVTKLQSLEKKVRYELNKKGLTAKYNFENIITYETNMKATLSKAVKIGMSDSSAIIYGESGTGKEMITQSIHNISDRRNEPFVAINCAALSESLLESELFGYEEGAFTGARKGGKPGMFELAHGGTIFLDEINSISLNLQKKLLRVLEEKEVMRIGSDYVIPLDVRILAATNENLRSKVEEGNFREDLFYRLNVIELHIPPLRDRKKDIIPIFKKFLMEFSNTSNLPEINQELEKKLKNYSWSGNVRELRNIAQQYTLFGEIELYYNKNTGFNKIDQYKENNEQNNTQQDINLKMNLSEINKFVEMKVISMLEGQGYNKNDIAKILGISRTSLWKKINSRDDNAK
ncbi:MAG: sigma 54-interacting transcriptional regulator [Sedimentibacter sp.]